MTVPREDEKKLFEFLKESIKSGEIDDTLRAASVRASARLSKSRTKKK